MTEPSPTTLRIASAWAPGPARWPGGRPSGWPPGSGKWGSTWSWCRFPRAAIGKRGRPIGALPSRGVFTKEIQRALLDGQIDLAVHSLKDLPTEPVAGLCLAAVPRRASTADVLVSPKFGRLDALPPGAVVGTGSLRRRAQLLRVRPDLRMADVRGNVETRLRKLDQGDFDALVLAEAGLDRLGLAARITQILPPAIVLSAVGQGALALETKVDAPAREFVRRLSHSRVRVGGAGGTGDARGARRGLSGADRGLRAGSKAGNWRWPAGSFRPTAAGWSRPRWPAILPSPRSWAAAWPTRSWPKGQQNWWRRGGEVCRAVAVGYASA